MKDAKIKIDELVKGYKALFPTEYANFLTGMRKKGKTEFGEIKGTDTLERVLLEYPETLHMMFEKQLSADELRYFTTKEGARWFGRAYPQFTITEKI